jgi:hypothetical protein
LQTKKDDFQVTIRKHFDNAKPGCGIDDDLGADYTKKYKTPMDDPGVYPGRDKRERSQAGSYTDNESGLTRTDNFEGSDSSNFGGSGSRDIMDDVESNQNPNGEFDTTGPIRAGVNRSQK